MLGFLIILYLNLVNAGQQYFGNFADLNASLRLNLNNHLTLGNIVILVLYNQFN